MERFSPLLQNLELKKRAGEKEKENTAIEIDRGRKGKTNKQMAGKTRRKYKQQQIAEADSDW